MVKLFGTFMILLLFVAAYNIGTGSLPLPHLPQPETRSAANLPPFVQENRPVQSQWWNYVRTADRFFHEAKGSLCAVIFISAIGGALAARA